MTETPQGNPEETKPFFPKKEGRQSSPSPKKKWYKKKVLSTKKKDTDIKKEFFDTKKEFFDTKKVDMEEPPFSKHSEKDTNSFSKKKGSFPSPRPEGSPKKKGVVREEISTKDEKEFDKKKETPIFSSLKKGFSTKNPEGTLDEKKEAFQKKIQKKKEDLKGEAFPKKKEFYQKGKKKVCSKKFEEESPPPFPMKQLYPFFFRDGHFEKGKKIIVKASKLLLEKTIETRTNSEYIEKNPFRIKK